MSIVNFPSAAEQRKRADEAAYRAARNAQFAKHDAQKAMKRQQAVTGDRTRPVPWKGYEGLVKPHSPPRAA